MRLMSARSDADPSLMRTIPLSECRANLSSLLHLVARTRQAIRVSRRGCPLVEIRPIPISAANKERLCAESEALDLEILNRFADEMNKDALDGLEDQADLFAEMPAGKAKRKSRKGQR